MNPFDLIKWIYVKTGLPKELKIDVGLCITVNKYLAIDPKLSSTVKGLLPYVFYIEPLHYFYLLYFSCPKVDRPPFLGRFKKDEEIEQSKLLSRVQYLLGWTDREMLLNQKILQSVVLEHEDHWTKALGV